MCCRCTLAEEKYLALKGTCPQAFNKNIKPETRSALQFWAVFLWQKQRKHRSKCFCAITTLMFAVCLLAYLYKTFFPIVWYPKLLFTDTKELEWTQSWQMCVSSGHKSCRKAVLWVIASTVYPHPRCTSFIPGRTSPRREIHSEFLTGFLPSQKSSPEEGWLFERLNTVSGDGGGWWVTAVVSLVNSWAQSKVQMLGQGWGLIDDMFPSLCLQGIHSF